MSSARIFLTGRNYLSGEYPVAAVVQDFNNDGISDIASANQKCARVLSNHRKVRPTVAFVSHPWG
jgi:hypothetical protein